MNTSLNVKCVIIGDQDVGKSCLIYRIVRGEFVEDVPDKLTQEPLGKVVQARVAHQPEKKGIFGTLFGKKAVEVKSSNVSAHVQLWDAIGREEYDKLRPLLYPSTDVFLFCYDSANSLASLSERWLPELRHHCPHVPIVLAQLKADQDSSVIEMPKNIELHSVVCSAKTGHGVEDVLNAIVANSSGARRITHPVKK